MISLCRHSVVGGKTAAENVIAISLLKVNTSGHKGLPLPKEITFLNSLQFLYFFLFYAKDLSALLNLYLDRMLFHLF